MSCSLASYAVAAMPREMTNGPAEPRLDGPPTAGEPRSAWTRPTDAARVLPRTECFSIAILPSSAGTGQLGAQGLAGEGSRRRPTAHARDQRTARMPVCLEPNPVQARSPSRTRDRAAVTAANRVISLNLGWESLVQSYTVHCAPGSRALRQTGFGPPSHRVLRMRPISSDAATRTVNNLLRAFPQTQCGRSGGTPRAGRTRKPGPRVICTV